MSRPPERAMPLRELERRPVNPANRPPERREFRHQRQEQPFRKPENLQVLREALKQTLEDKRKEDTKSDFGTLKPGEKIEL